MALESEVAHIFFEHVFSPKGRAKNWRVLVLDEHSTAIVSSCFRMQDIMDTGITLVENITKKRRVLPMEAIYILEPCKESVTHLLGDFSKNPKNYAAAYVYFTIACSDEILRQISASGCVRHFKTLTVLNIGFLPIESHVFSINCRDTAWLYTSPVERVPDMNNRLEILAEQIATLCVTLNEFPKIRYRKRARNLELAQFVQIKLGKLKEDNPQLGQGPHKDRSILLILDRGFDPLTPILHDLTLQSLIRDLKEIHGNNYIYGKGQTFELTGKDKLWIEYRNEHIADVSKSLPTRLRVFAESKQHFLDSRKKADEITSGTASLHGSQESINSVGTVSSGVVNYGADLPSDSSSNIPKSTTAGSLRALQTMVHEMPQYQKEAASYNALVSITDYCLSACRENINSICAVEQDLAMGQTAQGEAIHNPMMALVNVLKPDSMSEVDRFRLILIYILTQGGIMEANLEKLLDYARLSLTYKSLVAAMSSIVGVRLISSIDGSFDSPLFRGLPTPASAPSFIQYYLPIKGKRLRDVDENSYALSRWVPYLDDLLEKCISDDLDSQYFPYLGAQTSLTTSKAFLQPPSQGTISGANDLRGPSARFRAPSPRPDSSASGGSGAPRGAVVDSSDSTQRNLQGSGTSNDSRFSEGPSFGQSRMSDHCGPRLIVFVVGGITWPETRVSYSVTQRCVEARLAASEKSSVLTTATPVKSRGHLGKHLAKVAGSSAHNRPGQHILKNGGGTGWNWEVVIGGTGVLTPKHFVANLQSLTDHA